MTEIAPGVACLLVSRIANVYFVGAPGGGPWALVDTALSGRFEVIRAAAEQRYGPDAKPAAIYLTHGHGDHSGSALALAAYWDVPIYAHRREMPFVTGRSAYPPPDPTVGGTLAFLTRFTGSGAITDLGDYARELPPPGEPLPGMAGWRYVETPGHAPGHVSFFREEDRTLLAGDALATVDLDSLTALATQKQKLSRPPSPTTCDWVAARKSLYRLAELLPRTLACGHGVPMSGQEVAVELAAFADGFRIPGAGRYVSEPARTDETGIVELPPPAPDTLPKAAAALGIAALVGIGIWAAALRRKEKGND